MPTIRPWSRAIFWLLLAALCLAAAAPTPKEHYGYQPGDDYKLIDYKELTSYFQKLAQSSDRMRLVEYGKSSEGRASYLAIISSAENLKRLDQYKEMNRKLALGLATAEEARKFAAEGKVFVWIDSGLHASEVATVQHASDLAYTMLTSESEEVRRIRDKVILLQVPVINPDGLDDIVHWYRRNVGTPHEMAPLPKLYQKYAGHDNNRDWFMMNLRETRNVSKLLFEEWFPQIVYNQHQAPAFPARIFVPPYAEPLNPNIPAPVMEGINLIGSAMKERFARENKPGVLSYWGFDAWWNGGLRSVPAFHNMHGILTETAGHVYATPRVYNPSDFPERFGNGLPTKEPSVFYQRPWMGGKWSLRDAIEYMLTADFAILDLAATRSDAFLHKAWEMARANIDLGTSGKPYAYVVSADQFDATAAHEMVRRLQMGGIQVHRAKASFSANGKTYPAGSYVMLAGQAFRGYLVDLMEPQKYPELRSGTTGPTKRPYDVAGWTLSMNMGVQVDRAVDRFQAELESAGPLGEAPLSMDHKHLSSFVKTAQLLQQGQKVRWAADGKILTERESGFAQAKWELKTPRVGLYEPWNPNMDAGWTQWMLDAFAVPHSMLRNQDLRGGDLRSKYDTLILASQTAQSILHGIREGERSSRRSGVTGESPSLQRPEYTGGIGLQGAAQIEKFVREGGTLITFDSATELPLDLLPIGVRGLLRSEGGDGGGGGFYCPGSLLRAKVDNTHPLAFGMPSETTVFTSGGQVFEVSLMDEFNKGEREVKTVVSYASKDLLASGWVSGERAVAGKPVMVEARHGKGRIVLFGFRPQFRGQSFGTFKLVLNALYLGSAQTL